MSKQDKKIIITAIIIIFAVILYIFKDALTIMYGTEDGNIMLPIVKDKDGIHHIRDFVIIENSDETQLQK